MHAQLRRYEVLPPLRATWKGPLTLLDRRDFQVVRVCMSRCRSIRDHPDRLEPPAGAQVFYVGRSDESTWHGPSLRFARPVQSRCSLLAELGCANFHICTRAKSAKRLPAVLSAWANDKNKTALLVDCDIYSSAVEVFAFITDIVKSGIWLLVDDYWCYRGGDPKLGVRRGARRVGARHRPDWYQPL